jgi:hypothetical protein
VWTLNTWVENPLADLYIYLFTVHLSLHLETDVLDLLCCSPVEPPPPAAACVGCLTLGPMKRAQRALFERAHQNIWALSQPRTALSLLAPASSNSDVKFRASSSRHDLGVVCQSSEENADCSRLLLAFAAVQVMLEDLNSTFVGNHDNGCCWLRKWSACMKMQTSYSLREHGTQQEVRFSPACCWQ